MIHKSTCHGYQLHGDARLILRSQHVAFSIQVQMWTKGLIEESIWMAQPSHNYPMYERSRQRIEVQPYTFQFSPCFRRKDPWGPAECWPRSWVDEGSGGMASRLHGLYPHVNENISIMLSKSWYLQPHPAFWCIYSSSSQLMEASIQAGRAKSMAST